MSLGTATVRTPEASDAFLKALAKSCNVTAACRAAGIGRRTAYDWRNDDEAFAAAWDEAVEEAADALEAEAWRRGHDGVDKPVFYQGEAVGTVREHSDKLLEILLKAHRPERFVERIRNENTHAVTVKIEGPAADL